MNFKKQAPLLLCSLLALTPLVSNAQLSPRGIITDSRIKVVPYSQNQVVKVFVNYGYATTVELQKGEFVVNKSAMGKTPAWDVVFDDASSQIIIKANMKDAQTNLNFVTNKGRTYTLMLVPTPSTSRQTLRLRFKYPELNFSKVFASRYKTNDLLTHFGNPKAVNDAYTFWGDSSIAPVSAKDNGRFTILRFRRGAPIPAILAVDPATLKESIVNFRLQDGYVVLEGVQSQYTLRYGNHVTCLFNERALKRV